MSNRSIVLILHSIRSLWNVGAIFRTADAFAVDHIYFTGYTALPPRMEIHKTALGAEEWIPWSHGNIDDIVQSLKGNGYSVVSLEISPSSEDISSLPPTGDICIILGNEILGIPEEIQRMSDRTVHIPMLGRKNSLNVTTAAGIALYHFRHS